MIGLYFVLFALWVCCFVYGVSFDVCRILLCAVCWLFAIDWLFCCLRLFYVVLCWIYLLSLLGHFNLLFIYVGMRGFCFVGLWLHFVLFVELLLFDCVCFLVEVCGYLFCLFDLLLDCCVVVLIDCLCWLLLFVVALF